jgi:hypothetical protein
MWKTKELNSAALAHQVEEFTVVLRLFDLVEQELHGGQLILPYAMSDKATAIVSMPIVDLLKTLVEGAA